MGVTGEPARPGSPSDARSLQRVDGAQARALQGPEVQTHAAQHLPVRAGPSPVQEERGVQ